MFPSFKAGWEQIGNCVPPLLMKAIAEHVKQNILCHVEPRKAKTKAK
jgi:site-specific DNA-cytosine methylase